MIVYHGAIEIIQTPDIYHSYRHLDFGKGFYVTTVKEQAQRWARRKRDIYDVVTGIVNIYWLNDVYDGFRVKTVDDDLVE